MNGSGKEGSIPSLREAAKRDPQNESAWLNLASAAEAKGDRPIWIEALQKLVTLCPSVAKHRFQLGELLWENGKLEEARQLFDQVLEISPMHPSARRRLAEMSGMATPVKASVGPTRREDFIPVVPSPKMTEMPPEVIAASQPMSENMISELYGRKKQEKTPDFRLKEQPGKEEVTLNKI